MQRWNRCSSTTRYIPMTSAQCLDVWAVLFDQAPVGLALTTLDGLQVWVNQRWCGLLGAPREAFLGHPCLERISPPDREAGLDVSARTSWGGHASSTRTTRYLRTDGSLVWVRVNSSLVSDTTSATQYLLAVLEAIFPPHPHSDEAIPHLAHKPRLLTPLPTPLSSLAAREEMMAEARYPRGQEVLRQCLSAERPHEQWVHGASQRLLTLAKTLAVDTPLLGALALDQGEHEHTCRTEEVALIKSLEHLPKECERARAHVLAMQEVNQRLDTFLGLVSHELRTPLTSLKLQMQLAQRRLQRELALGWQEPSRQTEVLFEADTQLSKMGVHLARIEQVVQEMLETSWIQAGRLEPQLQPVEVPALVREVVEEQQQGDPTHRLEVQLEVTDMQVMADADSLRQVLTHYLTNALKYSPETAPVVVGLMRAPKEIRVWVRDQGPGLSITQQEAIWERYYQVPGVEVQNGSKVGLGLGLYLCKTLIERQGGRVGVQSTPGAGSTFWFTLALEQENRGPT